MDIDTARILEKGIACLHEHMGLIEMEIFISTIQREKFDYTKWHQRFADTMTEDMLDKLCRENAENHPFNGKAEVVI